MKRSRDSPFISIGKNVIIRRNSVVQALRIGDNVLIGEHCVIVLYTSCCVTVG